MASLKKRYRLSIWRREAATPVRPAHWSKVEARLLDAHEADLLRAVALNMGHGYWESWCDGAWEIGDRLVVVETWWSNVE